jgi:hypothetical protein
MKQNLNLENFFDRVKVKYPNTMQQFCDWIDKYKKEVNWDKLFGNDIDPVRLVYNEHKIKFHHLPIEMQMGILYRWAGETLYGNSSEIEEIEFDELSELVESCMNSFEHEHNSYHKTSVHGNEETNTQIQEGH